MKSNIHIISCILVIFLFSSCKTNKGSLSLDLKAPYPNSVLDETSFFSPADTIVLHSDSLNMSIEAGKVYPGEKYIIVYSYNKILVFPKDSAFSQVLAGSGRGPGEVTRVLDIKMDSRENNLFCLQNNRNEITVYDLKKLKLKNKIPVAKNQPLTSFDFINDSLLVCFPLLSIYNNTLAFTQDLSGNLIREITIDEPIEDGPVYNQNPVTHKVKGGFIYMPHPLNTVYFIDSTLTDKRPLLTISKNEDKTKFINYRILFPDNDPFILSVKTNVLKGGGDGNLLLFPESEKFYKIDLTNHKINSISGDQERFCHMSFYKQGKIVITVPGNQDENNTILIGEIII